MKALVEAAVKAGLGEVAKEFFVVIKTVYEFKATFKRLEATMLAILPVIEDMNALNIILDRPVEELDLFNDRLKQGKDLIVLCSRVNEWNPMERYNKSKEVQTFNKVLIDFFQIYVPAFQVRGIKQLTVGVAGLTDKVDTVNQTVDIVKENVDVVKKNMDRMKETLEDVHERMDINKSTNTARSINRFPGSAYHAQIPELTPGVYFPLKCLKTMLLGDNDVVLLSAPPGCGKTTLANMVCLDSAIKEKFKANILFVTVSKTAKIMVIVKTIFEQRGYPVEQLEFQSDEDAINQLGQLLNQIGGRPVLLVLDDVWPPELEALVHNFMFKGNPEYKILVTSRSESSAFQCSCKINPLDHEDAKLLFNHWCFPPGNNYPAVSNETVEKVVRTCMGFPLALKLVALSLRGKPEVVWVAKLKLKLSKGPSTILDSYKILLNNLKTSLDALDEEEDMGKAKEGFLDLGSFPEDQSTSANVLLDMWAELYELDEKGVSTLYNLLELASRNLLNLEPTRLPKFATNERNYRKLDDSTRGIPQILIDLLKDTFSNDSAYLKDGYCYGQFVTLHDMLRVLAIQQCGQGDINLRKKLIIEITGECQLQDYVSPLAACLVSISTDNTFKSKWRDMELPQAEVLILNFRSKTYTLPQFMKHMNKLKVMIVTNYGFFPAELDNFPVGRYLSSLKRIRLEHVSISSTLTTSLQLMKLQKLSLTMCEIGNAFDNCMHVFPNLLEIEMDYCRDLVELPVGICDIIHLNKISITSCNELRVLPEEIGKLTNLQSLRFNSCTKLEKLPETIGWLKQLSVLDISDCVNLSKMPIQIGDLQNLKTLHMRGCWGMSELPTSVKDLKNLTVFCDTQTAALWKIYTNVVVHEVKEHINLNWLKNQNLIL